MKKFLKFGLLFDSSGAGVENRFVSTWNTANTSTGSSTSTQVQLPFRSTGTYDCVVDWGDGNTDPITSWNQAETLHTYSSSGSYVIAISGQCEGFAFANAGDRLKITDISSWGNQFRVGNDSEYFYGCENLDISAVAPLNLQGTTTARGFFRKCTSLINASGSIGNWDTSNITDMLRMFIDTFLFNQDISGWDVSSVTNMNSMLRGSAFDQDIGGWDVSSVTNMANMFFNTSFDQNVGGWDVSSVTNMTNMFFNSELSTVNYDALLIGWESQSLQSGVAFHGGSSQYSAGAAATARSSIISTYSWTITDGGQV